MSIKELTSSLKGRRLVPTTITMPIHSDLPFHEETIECIDIYGSKVSLGPVYVTIFDMLTSRVLSGLWRLPVLSLQMVTHNHDEHLG
jgi:hypothetical protein